MATLLHIAASPRKQRSASREVAEAFIESYRHGHAHTQLRTLDLWDTELPEFNGEVMAAKYAGLSGTPLTAAQEHAWSRLQAMAAQLHEADILVLSVPLWNFGIPYKLKHFIDLVSQKDILFGFDPVDGLCGLLRNKTAVVAYARGLDFGEQSDTPASRFDFQQSYMQAWLRFVGVTDQHSLVVDKTVLGSEVDEAARAGGRLQARQLALALGR